MTFSSQSNVMADINLSYYKVITKVFLNIRMYKFNKNFLNTNNLEEKIIKIIKIFIKFGF